VLTYFYIFCLFADWLIESLKEVKDQVGKTLTEQIKEEKQSAKRQKI
jgi:hypothetical protein